MQKSGDDCVTFELVITCPIDVVVDEVVRRLVLEYRSRRNHPAMPQMWHKSPYKSSVDYSTLIITVDGRVAVQGSPGCTIECEMREAMRRHLGAVLAERAA